MNLFQKKLFIVPVIGYSFCRNTDYEYGNGSAHGSVTMTNGQHVNYNYTSYYTLIKTFPLMQTGIGLEFSLLNTALFSLSANYYSGFTEVIVQDIQYTFNGSSPQNATAVSKGQMLSIAAGIKYPISNFWSSKIPSDGQ